MRQWKIKTKWAVQKRIDEEAERKWRKNEEKQQDDDEEREHERETQENQDRVEAKETRKRETEQAQEFRCMSNNEMKPANIQPSRLILQDFVFTNKEKENTKRQVKERKATIGWARKKSSSIESENTNEQNEYAVFCNKIFHIHLDISCEKIKKEQEAKIEAKEHEWVNQKKALTVTNQKREEREVCW